MSDDRMTFIGAGQTVTVHGVGQHQLFDVFGAPQGFNTIVADAHLIVEHGLGFKGTVDLGPQADVFFKGVTATSYTLANGILDLFQGNTVVDELHVNLPTNRFFNIWSLPATSAGPGSIYIGTGYAGLGGGLLYGIYPHVS
jgi:hypothetical protein